MTKLNEKEVLARSHATCLENVRKLICWGNSLTDISIVQNMVNLEVLNLSVNNITTLKPLSYCPRLKEIYIRKNQIRLFEEIGYLKNLPQLTVLWISDNPIADLPEYRQTVLRNLPGLVKLDSVDVKTEEKNSAFVKGQLIENDEVLPDYKGLDLNHTLTSEAVMIQTRKNLERQSSKSDEKPERSAIDANESVNSEHSFKDSPLDTSSICNGNATQHKKNMSSTSAMLNDKSMRKSRSNTLSAIILLLNDLDQSDLLEVQTHTQDLLKSYTEPGRSNRCEELLED